MLNPIAPQPLDFFGLAEKCFSRQRDDEEREKEEAGVLPESVLQGLESRHHGRLQQVAKKAPTGAFIVTVVYYRSAQPLFEILSISADIFSFSF